MVDPISITKDFSPKLSKIYGNNFNAAFTGTARTTKSESCISIRDPFLSTSPSFSASSKWLLFLSIPIILKSGYSNFKFKAKLPPIKPSPITPIFFI